MHFRVPNSCKRSPICFEDLERVRMEIPIVNRTEHEIMLGLEPEGDTIPLAPGQTVIVKTVGTGSEAPGIELDIEEGLVSISIMCEKEVWSGGMRLR